MEDIKLYLFISSRWLEDLMQVTMYKWDWITEGEALLQSISIERKQLYEKGTTAMEFLINKEV
jgi:hypothetical protein